MVDLSEYIKDECRVDGNVIKLGSRQLSRDEYLSVKKLLESRGGKWKGGKVGGFVFPSDAEEIYGSICGGDMSDRKKDLQFFATPDIIADRMVESLSIGEDDKFFLEPSAGSGQLIKAVRRVVPSAVFDTYEINTDCFPLLEKIDGVKLYKVDFLLAPDDKKYDVIIANPPFSKNQDIAHFRKMYGLLNDGGRLCCIMSEHAFNGKEKVASEFREWLNGLDANIEDIEEGAFKESGTNVRAKMVTVRK